MMSNSPKPDEGTIQEIVELWEDTHKKEIAEEVGTTPATVSRCIKKYGKDKINDIERQDNYEDRLNDHESVEELIGTAKKRAEEMAADHFERCYDGTQCAACAEETPIDVAWGPWFGMAVEFTEFTEAVEAEVMALDGSLTEYNEALDEHLYWVYGDLAGVYFEAFNEAATNPEDCLVCTREIVATPDPMCGHERDGEDCPARS